MMTFVSRLIAQLGLAARCLGLPIYVQSRGGKR